MNRARSSIPAMVVAVLSVVVVLFAPDPIRIAIGIPFALVIPGYLLSAALFPGADIDRARRAMLTPSLSIAVVILVALPLHLTVGLRPVTWAVALAVVDGAIYLVARRRSLAAGAQSRPLPRFDITRRDVVLLAFAVVLVSAATALALTPLSARHVDGYTALWIVPKAGENTVRVGVRSGELQPFRYRLVVRGPRRRLLNRVIGPVEPGTVVIRTIRVPAAGGTTKALLYRLQRPGTVYRSVSITVPRHR